ncbi:uric acid degradation bifunctional protein TTL-like [Mercurialis annua]|uniref:uric acid degradation bifunctional protein TTL-like n=1 Tax=Mercurialis annua TaxID=3986 RepID=UPI002160CC7D|nr:uric acid degradation bifunctional protein TTL-like [Mercurialis annua]
MEISTSKEKMMMFEEKDLMACCGSTKFAKEMTLASPFTSPEQAVAAATNIWFNKVAGVGLDKPSPLCQKLLDLHK